MCTSSGKFSSAPVSARQEGLGGFSGCPFWLLGNIPLAGSPPGASPLVGSEWGSHGHLLCILYCTSHSHVWAWWKVVGCYIIIILILLIIIVVIIIVVIVITFELGFDSMTVKTSSEDHSYLKFVVNVCYKSLSEPVWLATGRMRWVLDFELSSSNCW